MSSPVSFEWSGSVEVDAILDAVEQSANWYHNTNQWHEPSWEDGKTCADMVGAAAVKAGERMLRLESALRDALAAMEHVEDEERASLFDHVKIDEWRALLTRKS